MQGRDPGRPRGLILRAALTGLTGLWLIAAPVQAQQGPNQAVAPSVVLSDTLSDLTAAAEAGQVNAQFALGERYHAGDGVLQNFATAASWYQRAARAGHAGAQNRLGQYYHAGLGVVRSQEQALHWLQAAADQGDPRHILDLARVLENGADGSSDPAAAARYYEQAAEAGLDEAAVSLGVLYQNGTGVEQDLARALDLYRGPAERGDARARNNLGLMYVRGTGVPQDYTRAAELFAKAAQQGLPTAMENLGVMYDNGFGVAQDDATAVTWTRRAAAAKQTGQKTNAGGLAGVLAGVLADPRLAPPATDAASLQATQRAARAGDPVAQFLMGWVLATQDPPAPGARQEAARWFRAAADKGHGPSMANLGLFYLRGEGLPQDYMLGYMWLTLAGSAGVAEALAQGAEIRPRMTAGQINEAQTRAAGLWARLHQPNPK